MSSGGPFSDILVVDLTRVLAGPYCTMVLSDLGARVIKVEPPGAGDDARHFGPFVKEKSAYFMSLNRGKESIALNLKDDADRRVFENLLAMADVLVENYRPGTMERLGYGWENLHERYPRLIYAATSGFGHSGPYSKRPAYDMVIQAMGGIMSITGWPDSPPTRTGTAIADVLAGLSACVGILTSLLAVRDGRPGQKVDIALVDSVVSAMETIIQIYLVEKRIPQRIGNRYEFICPYDAFRAKNGWVILGVGNNKLWRSFCEAINRPDLLDNPKFKDNYDRVKAHEEIKHVVEEWTGTREIGEVVDYFCSKKIPCAPIYSVKEVVEDEHIAGARRMIREIDHPVAGSVKVVGSPVNLSETPAEVHSAAPLLGQHSESVLRDILGLSPAEIRSLKQQKVVG